MKLATNLSLTKRAGGVFALCKDGTTVECAPDHSLYPAFSSLYDEFYHIDAEVRERKALGEFADTIANLKSAIESGAVTVDPAVVKEPSEQEKLMDGLQKLLDFFTEFTFEPNFRFVNTICQFLTQKGGKDKAQTFIANYFSLTDDPHYKEIAQKVKSRELQNILSLLGAVAPTKRVNSRFKVYYGSAGTGKTTKAQAECENRCVVCNNSMLPADLMEDFCFVDGKPSFKPSVLWNCMTEGKAIVLDEINLLPFDSLRFLQGVLDGKKEFSYKGHEVKIADGFCIIGTMNLVVNGATFNLPEPLVDRCMDIQKFSLSAGQLLGAIM